MARRTSLTLFAPKMMHHRADALDADVSVLGFAVPQPPVQTVNLRDDHRFRRRSFRIIRRQAAGDLRQVLQPHADVEPVCVRQSPGKEDGCNLKPFIALQRVRPPPGKGRSPPAGSEPCMGGGNAAREA
jgi:hypothetical protein